MTDDLLSRLRYPVTHTIYSVDVETMRAAADEIESLRQQLITSQKQNVHLRSALEEIRNGTKGEHPASVATKALAATADLEGLVLCDGEPVCFIPDDVIPMFAPPKIRVLGVPLITYNGKNHTPLYRAREQK